MSNERQEFTVMSTVVGTGSGWDQAGDFAIIIYDLEPSEVLKKMVPEIRDRTISSMFVDSENGKFELYGRDDEVMVSGKFGLTRDYT